MLKRGLIGRKGQVTFFLIVGIIILLVFGAIFFLKHKTVKEEALVNEDLVDLPNSGKINYFVQSCLEKVSEDGLLKMGRQGGYYQSPLDYSIIFFHDLMPYYYADEKMMLLSVNDSETELEKYIQDNLPTCIDNFSSFEKEKYQIQAGKMKINVNYKNQVLIKLDYPLIISRGISIVELNSFNHQINLELPKFFSASKQLVEDSLSKPGYVCLTCMENLASQENLKIESYPIHDQSYFENDIIWYRIGDKKKSELAGQNFSFEFVIEYLTPEKEVPLLIEEVKTLEAKVGEPFFYQAKTNKENVIFKDDTELFEIGENGAINFTPGAKDKSIHFVTITAEDNSGKQDQELFVLKVI